MKALPGLGTTVDVILVNGCISESDTIVVAGQEGPVVTQVRGLLMPQPLRELRVKVSIYLIGLLLLLIIMPFVAFFDSFVAFLLPTNVQLVAMISQKNCQC